MKFVDEFDAAEHTDPTRDIPNVRKFYLDNSRVLELKRKDPYGFVYVVWDNGRTPEELSGAYTSFDAATKALTLWINNNTFTKPSETPVAPVEPLKYKKKYRDPETGENLAVA